MRVLFVFLMCADALKIASDDWLKKMEANFIVSEEGLKQVKAMAQEMVAQAKKDDQNLPAMHKKTDAERKFEFEEKLQEEWNKGKAARIQARIDGGMHPSLANHGDTQAWNTFLDTFEARWEAQQ